MPSGHVRVQGLRNKKLDQDELFLAQLRLSKTRTGVDLTDPIPTLKTTKHPLLAQDVEDVIDAHSSLASEAMERLKARHRDELEDLKQRIITGELLTAPPELVLPALVAPEFSSRFGIPSQAVLHARGWHRLAQFCFQLSLQDLGRDGL